jgi:hypothetical protein
VRAIFDDELPEDEDEDDTVPGGGPPLPRGWPDQGGYWWPAGSPPPSPSTSTSGVGEAFMEILRQGHSAFAHWQMFDRFAENPMPMPMPMDRRSE